jgi:Nucleotidyltransferase domain
MPGEPTFPPVVAGILEHLTVNLTRTGLVDGLYLYGSLTTGDYSPARSDIDLVAVTVPAGLSKQDVGRLQAAHENVAGMGGPAARLNCLYVRAGTLDDAERLHPYWYGDHFTQWQQTTRRRALCGAAHTMVWAAPHRRAGEPTHRRPRWQRISWPDAALFAEGRIS